MTQKNRFENIVKDVTEQFKKIEERNERIIKQQSKKETKPAPSQSTLREQKLKQHQENEKSNIKGKFRTCAVVFVVGHLMIIPAYMNHPHLIPQIFLVASFSLGIICLAIMDYG